MSANETPRENGAIEESAGRRVLPKDTTDAGFAHPAAFQPMPPLSPAAYDALRADIEMNGVITPVVVDQYGRILDGNNRVEIAAALGVEYPRVVQHVDDDDDAEDLAVTLNCARRHLTREQQRDLIRREIARRPSDSDRAIARRIGCSPSTVGSIRRPAPEVSNLDTSWTAPADVDPADFESAMRVYDRLNFEPRLPQSDAEAEWLDVAVLYEADNPLTFQLAIAAGAGRPELVAAVLGRMALWKSTGMDRKRIHRLFDPWVLIALSDAACGDITNDMHSLVGDEPVADNFIEAMLGRVASLPRFPEAVAA